MQDGNVKQGVVAVGHTVGLIDGVVAVKELIDTMAREAPAIQ